MRYLFLFVFLLLSASVHAQEKLIEIPKGINPSPFGKTIKAWRDNMNAHGYYIIMFLDANGDIIAIDDNRKKIAKTTLSTAQAAECKITDYRLFYRELKTYLVEAEKLPTASYCDPVQVTFHVFELINNNAAETPQFITPHYFSFLKMKMTEKSYSSVTSAFKDFQFE